MRWYTCIKYKKYFIYVCILIYIYIYLHIYRERVDVNIYIYIHRHGSGFDLWLIYKSVSTKIRHCGVHRAFRLGWFWLGSIRAWRRTTKKKLFVPEFFLGLHWSCQNLLDSFKRLVAATGKETPLHFHRVKADMNCMDLYMVQTYNWFLLVLQKSVLTPEAQ